MDWTEALTRVIELNTFSSIWYWLAVAVSWAAASNWLIGVPFDVLYRARKCPPQELADLETLVEINVRRITMINDQAGVALTALLAFTLAMLGMAGFYYGFELAQGFFVLAAPLSVVIAINMRLAHQLRATPLAGQALVSRLLSVRFWTQVIAMVAIFFTSMYGMYFNLEAMLFF